MGHLLAWLKVIQWSSRWHRSSHDRGQLLQPMTNIHNISNQWQPFLIKYSNSWHNLYQTFTIYLSVTVIQETLKQLTQLLPNIHNISISDSRPSSNTQTVDTTCIKHWQYIYQWQPFFIKHSNSWQNLYQTFTMYLSVTAILNQILKQLTELCIKHSQYISVTAVLNQMLKQLIELCIKQSQYIYQW